MSTSPAGVPAPALDADLKGYAMSCPRFQRCNAAYCPADQSGRHLDGDVVCSLMLESVKPGAVDRLSPILLGPLLNRVMAEGQARLTGGGGIGRALTAAALTGSRLDSGKALGARSRSPVAA